MTTIDRRSLNFAEVVTKHFGFLPAHGFRCVHSEPTLVRFESKRAYVNVYHGRKSFEVSLEIGPPARREEAPYSMSAIIRLMDLDRADEYRNYAARTVAGVEEGVQLLAALFRRYVDAGLLDDVGLLDRLQKQREAWSRDFARQVDLGHAREKLDAAWHAKDYEKVVELLEPFRANLTAVELKKLEYAKKHMAQS